MRGASVVSSAGPRRRACRSWHQDVPAAVGAHRGSHGSVRRTSSRARADALRPGDVQGRDDAPGQDVGGACARLSP
jgi:hypothetical protein